MNTTLYENRSEDTQNGTNFLGPHDYWICYVNIDLRHRYGISATESQTFLCVKRPQRQRARRNGCFRRLGSPVLSVSGHKYMWASQYVRSRTGRLLLERLQVAEEENQDIDTTSWYKCINSSLSEELQAKFVESTLDKETEAFLENCHQKADSVLSQIGHLFFKGFFGYFFSVTTVNGILDRGSMFVFSNAQFQNLMGVDGTWKAAHLLDLGAGDGKVTSVMKQHFDEVYVTEQSPSMRWRLSSRGFKLLDETEWANVDFKFDVVACLNLLDRCDKPLTLLADIKRTLHPVTGRLLVAVVLPFKPCVESGTKIIKPSEIITVNGSTWEEQVNSLGKDVFEPCGFTVEQFTRVPYLCEGDLYQDYYMLDDALFVLKITA